MSEIKVLTLNDSESWEDYLNRLPIEQRDVYFTPQHYRLYQEKGEGLAYCFIYECDGKIALNPFLLNRINDLGYCLEEDYYDVQGAYGYNGIATNCSDEDFIKELGEAWLGWIKQQNVIAEFIRYNPVLRNEHLSPWAPPIDVLDNVLLPLTNYEDIWHHSYERGVRNAVRKGEKNGLTFMVEFCDEISPSAYAKFVELYLDTMQRRSADGFYFFDDAYFVKLRDYMKNNLFLVAALYDGQIISIDLYLHNNIVAYGYLSGTNKDFFQISPNSFLRDRTIRTLIERGFKYYSIGGGLSRNDSIYKYKKNFSVSTESIFYIGKKIHNSEVYSDICSQWELRAGTKQNEYGNLLLKYRYGV
jgi:hypothetical protein